MSCAHGIRIALATMEAIVHRARGNAVIRDWAIRAAGDNVAYPTPASKASRLLNMIRRVAPYIASPGGTFPPGDRAIDADDEAVALASACEAIGMEVKLRVVESTNHRCTVAVDVRQGPDWVTFTMGEKLS